MHISLLSTSVPPEPAHEQALLESNLTWLRAELERARGATQRASLLNEIGVLEQLAGRDSAAVRELLGAVNALPRFREPLENLIVLIERHRAFKNLPKVLEHLERIGEGPRELGRARVARIWFTLSHGKSDERARALLEGVELDTLVDPASLVTLEVVARRRSDVALLRHALERRAELASSEPWSRQLRLELAQLEAERGEYAAARRHLDVLAATRDELGFVALEHIAQLGRRTQRPEWTSRALEEQATRIIEALGAPESTRVPPSLKTKGSAAVRCIELARLEERRGDRSAGLRWLERASELVPDDPVIAQASLELSRGQHDVEIAALERELEHPLEGRERAAIALRLAEVQALRGEAPLALEAIRRAVAAAPECWVARARGLDVLQELRDDVGRARWLEGLAEVLSSAEAKQRHWLLAAQVWARECRDEANARKALSHAGDAGAPRLAVARVARALAHVTENGAWYHATLRELLARETNAQERGALALESWRLSSLRGDDVEAREAAELLDSIAETRSLARLERSYLRPDQASPDAAEALLSLAAVETDAARALWLEWLAALRFATAGAAGARDALLARLHAAHPKSTLVAGTLYGALAGSPRAAEVLLRTAATLDDASLAAALYIEAGLRDWRAGDAESALGAFEAAERVRPGAAAALLEWARLAHSSRASREAASRDPRERIIQALERAAHADSISPQHASDLALALRGAGAQDADGSGGAARLLSILLARALGTRADPSALERLAALGPDASRLADALRYLDGLSQADPTPKGWEEVTRAWFQSSGDESAAFEWLAATLRLAQRGAECSARRRVAELANGAVRDALVRSSVLVAHLSQSEPVRYLEGEAPATALLNLETSPPGCDPARRSAALGAVDALLDAGSSATRALLAGYNHLAVGAHGAAASAFGRYIEAFPDDPSGWEGSLAAARHGDDPAALAEATAGLARTARDARHAARLLEEAALVLLERMGDHARARVALTRAVELDPSRGSSFERLLRMVIESGEPGAVLSLVDRRAPFVTTSAEQAWLWWERARAERRLGKMDAALASLDALGALDPDHPGALALRGEIYVSTRQHARAAEILARLAALPSALPEDRLTSGLCAIDLFENHLHDTRRALQILMALHRAGLSTLAVRERLARSAAKAEAWDEAVVVLEQLMHERSTPEQRAEAARLALSIHRDRRSDGAGAARAARALLASAPGDVEALELVLAAPLDAQGTAELLRQSRRALLDRIGADPLHVECIAALARLARHAGDARLRQVTLGGLAALGHGDPAVRAELAELEARIVVSPDATFDERRFSELADPAERPGVARMFAALAPELARAFGPTLRNFEVGRRARVAPDPASPLWAEISAWVTGFGLGPFDLYLSPIAADRVSVVMDDGVAVVIGPEVRAPLGALQRLELVRALYATRRGLGALLQLDASSTLTLLEVACGLGGAALDGPETLRHAELERELRRALPRKVLKQLPSLTAGVEPSRATLDEAVRASVASLDRASAIAVGDASLVLTAALSPAIGSVVPPPELERYRRLLAFMFSSSFEALRDHFGARVR